MSRETFLGLLGLAWLALSVVVVFYPLVTGRMRIGAPHSTPVNRSEDPGGFWFAWGLSTAGFVVATVALAWLLLKP